MCTIYTDKVREMDGNKATGECYTLHAIVISLTFLFWK